MKQEHLDFIEHSLSKVQLDEVEREIGEAVSKIIEKNYGNRGANVAFDMLIIAATLLATSATPEESRTDAMLDDLKVKAGSIIDAFKMPLKSDDIDGESFLDLIKSDGV